MQEYHFSQGTAGSYSFHGKLILFEWYKKQMKISYKLMHCSPPPIQRTDSPYGLFINISEVKWLLEGIGVWDMHSYQHFRRSNLKHLLTLERVMLKQKTVLI